MRSELERKIGRKPNEDGGGKESHEILDSLRDKYVK
jgi:hypothetical protein